MCEINTKTGYKYTYSNCNISLNVSRPLSPQLGAFGFGTCNCFEMAPNEFPVNNVLSQISAERLSLGHIFCGPVVNSLLNQTSSMFLRQSRFHSSVWGIIVALEL